MTAETERKTITINDFKMWLSGVEEMQDLDSWSPTKQQWDRIRAKINDVEDVPALVYNTESRSTSATDHNTYVASRPVQAPQPYPMEEYAIHSSSLDALPPGPIDTGRLSPIFSTGGANMTKTPDLNGGIYDPTHLI